MSDSKHNLTLKELSSSLDKEVKAFVGHPAFRTAWQRLDMRGFSEQFNSFSENIKLYNAFHRRERRLWAVKIRSGTVSKEQEEDLKRRAPQAMEQYKAASQAMDRCVSCVVDSGFEEVVDAQLGQFMRHMGNPRHPLSRVAENYFIDIGSSREMISEFRRNYRPFEFDFINRLGRGHFSNLRDLHKEGVDAQLNMLAYTRDHGLRYIRGCDPPTWAIWVSEILAYAGIGINAWIVAAIIVFLVAIIILICSLNILPSNIQQLCNYAGFTLGLSW